MTPVSALGRELRAARAGSRRLGEMTMMLCVLLGFAAGIAVVWPAMLEAARKPELSPVATGEVPWVLLASLFAAVFGALFGSQLLFGYLVHRGWWRPNNDTDRVVGKCSSCGGVRRADGRELHLAGCDRLLPERPR